MNQKYNLNTKKILEKEFHVDMKGYSTHEVDVFLDLVIEDYEAYDQYVEELGTHLQNYEAEIKKLHGVIAELEATLKYESGKQQSVDQVDLLKRISNLEKTVFKK
ncbi:cell division initiation protein [Breznakia sp. PF5-3]|uniref:DivIVA domain-containing protein n=1 Tax=unclassified Breznakia TaxID=2623764 RepID=UPI00240564E7|nr:MULTISPECIES: DivIVA domain-containing protein [unclassified Breznakia]MDF9824619.1 cell division initiation protein [Breznakia sp. PM6-1]MDF9835555.1 cell division initiation protein [Breznakia sp. PF5-3]MDF9837943.1 cell division initiation protein [Breznakia sp. PFB2-8]MDF9859932.1 cell division initiation protein [Breznakia sp. PH5-24]